jgi:CDGSH-type Zn-finger protein/uncharacterized Fe-S cluster protein YjdI
MSKQEKITYPGGQTQVHWDGKLCIHYGECGRASGDLFIGGRQPWCQPDLSDDADIQDIVLRCPTGALTATFANGSAVEPDNEDNQTSVTQNGPLYVSGKLDIDGVTQQTSGLRYRAALCRCGASNNKPFCDNSHIEAGFNDSGAVGEAGSGLSTDSGDLKIRTVPNGPLLLNGGLTIYASSGRKAWQGEKAALCRCGESQNKPFCDGSHKAANFKG